jgi:hypothetical protein
LWEKERDKEWKPNIGEENKKKREKEFEQITKNIYIEKKKAWIFESQNPTLGGITHKKKREKRGKKK